MDIRSHRPPWRHGLAGLGVVLAMSFAPATVLAQWDHSARLGLSAAPDRHLGTLDATIGAPFELHVILTGMPDAEPLEFALHSVQWLVNTACCGDSPVGVVDLVHGPGIDGSGDPYEGITSLAAGCPAGDTIVLATVTFDWLMDGDTEFVLSAVALTGALDCDDQAHLLQTLAVLVTGQDPTPLTASTWSQIKTLFTTGGRSP